MNTYKQYSSLLKHIEEKYLESEINTLLEKESAYLRGYNGVLQDVDLRFKNKENLLDLLEELQSSIMTLKSKISPKLNQLRSFITIEQVAEEVKSLSHLCREKMTLKDVNNYTKKIDLLLLKCQKVKKNLDDYAQNLAQKQQQIQVISNWKNTHILLLTNFQGVNNEITQLLNKTKSNIDCVSLENLDHMVSCISNAEKILSNIRSTLDKCSNMYLSRDTQNYILATKQDVEQKMLIGEIRKYHSELETLLKNVIEEERVRKEKRKKIIKTTLKVLGYIVLLPFVIGGGILYLIFSIIGGSSSKD